MNRIGSVLVKYFKASEFKAPDHIEPKLLLLLDGVRDEFGGPFFITSDGRDPEHNKRVGGVPTSLHLYDAEKGLKCHAVDFWFNAAPRPYAQFAQIAEAVATVSNELGVSYQLEIVYSDKDKHIHLGIFRDPRPSELIFALD